ncbi:MAG: tetraacyldisaccharide 4'-kinase [Rugosibacter sp.]|nr:tetraacyldisaccharide 4'-kinase [Rugosibacter sp.]
MLYPVSLVFASLTALRLLFYRAGIFLSQHVSVPVIVIGNLTVGGTGKTPLILHLATQLRARGMHPGIVSRGYGGSAKEGLEVTADSDAAVVGDEPLLLAQRSLCPLFIGRDRVRAAQALLSRYPACNVILSDDGLQHYRLARDVEIAVFDQRGIMNGWQLPAGPLREPVSRLKRVDAVVFNSIAVPHGALFSAVSSAPTFNGAVFAMRLEGISFYRFGHKETTCRAEDFLGKKLHAVAGIGFPQRFFDHLQAMGLVFDPHPFADHHDYQRGELNFSGDAILTTEKDAVKFTRLNLTLPVWVLPVTANVSPDLVAFILEKLNGCAPA